MLRAKWEFEYTASELARAAEGQRDFRTSRIAVWKQKEAEVIAKIKESGLEVHEDITGLLSNNINSLKYGTSAMGGAQIVIDPTMQGDLNKCYMKIKEHTEMERQYAAWVQVLDGNPKDRVKLDHDDWTFFFGK
jgi:hypothetical protein